MSKRVALAISLVVSMGLAANAKVVVHLDVNDVNDAP